MSQGRVTVGHPVDVGSGAVFTLSTDFRVPGSIELHWRRHYSTAAVRDMWLGAKWTVPYFMSLERQSDRYILIGAHGDEVTFPSTAPLRSGAFLANVSSSMELRREDDHYSVLHWHVGGNTSRFCFKTEDRPSLALSWIENLAGHKVLIEYDLAGRPARLIQELERRVVEIVYGRHELISEIHFFAKTGRKLLVQYEYDERRLIAAFDAMGHRKGYEYDQENRLVAEANPLGSRFIFEYDRLGRCTRTAGDDGFMERKLQYLAAPPMTRVTDSRGAVTEYHLNRAGQVVQLVAPGGGVTSKTFDEHGRLVAVEHPDGSKESHAYDDKGSQVESVDACGSKTTVEHNDLHVPVRVVDRNRNTWKLPNKHEGSLAGVENLPHRLWNYDWDARQLVSQARSPGGWAIGVRRDEHFRWQETHDQTSLVRRTEFDEFGYATKTFDAEGLVSQTSYDDLHRALEVRRGPSDLVRYEWNAIGKRTGRIGPGNQRNTWQYNKYGYLVAQTNSLGDAVRFEYNSEGKLIAITNRVGERVEYRRDAQGRIVQEKLFDGRIQAYEYDLLGRRVRIQCSDGRTVDQTFDAAGRLLSRKASDGLIDEFAYDKEGRVVKAWNEHAQVELKRDRFGRIAEEAQNGRRVRYEYDVEWNRIGRSLPFSVTGSQLKRAFDTRGRLLALQDERGVCQEFRWDHLDRLFERRCPGDVLELFRYNDQRRLLEQRIETRNGHIVRTHTYDAGGNLAVFEDNRKGVFHYTYDRINRLLEVRSGSTAIEAYEYDANHAIGRTHRGPRRLAPGGKLLQDDSREIRYGADGAVAATQLKSLACSLKHDVNGRLVQVAQPNRQLIRYEYDPFGRRTAKIVNGERTEFLWEGWALAAEIRNEQVDTIYFCAELRPIAQWTNGKRLTPILDSRGAVQEVFDDSGQQRWSCTLDAYGNLLSEKGAVASPFRLRGQYHDRETGFYYNFHRHYDPQLGDYTAPDPIGLAGGHNFYAYPRNPLRWDDPFGLECGDPEQHKDDPPEEEPPSKPATGPAPLADPPEEPPPGTPLSKDEAFDKAAAARDEKLAELDGLSAKQRNKVATVVGACDPETGQTGLGVKVTGQDRDMCAEDLAKADLASKTDTDPSKFVYSPAIRPRNDETIPVCARCQDRGITPDQLPPGTPFEPRPEGTPGPGSTPSTPSKDE